MPELDRAIIRFCYSYLAFTIVVYVATSTTGALYLGIVPGLIYFLYALIVVSIDNYKLAMYIRNM